MQEKLVEHWLTSSNELNYQLPYCEVLISRGFDVLHVSTHGRGEHGKDIVARDKRGRLCTFQLKGGDIGLHDWRTIRGEVEELVQLPVRIPGVSEDEQHIPYLVTNGEIRGDALESITRFRERWANAGYPKLRVFSRRTLLRQFLDAQGHFMPSGLGEFRQFVELFVADFTDRLPREKFAKFLENTLDKMPTTSELKLTRSFAGISVIAGYVVEQYERANNHVSAAEAWTITASVIMHTAEKMRLGAKVYQPVLRMLSLALDRNLDKLVDELSSRDDFVEGRNGIADPYMYGARASLVFGWLSATAHWKRIKGDPAPAPELMTKLLRREGSAIRFLGEVDWPAVLLLAIYVEQVYNSSEAELLIEKWVRLLLALNRKNGAGVPSPYWHHDQVISLANGLLAPNELENFFGNTFSLAAALDMLVRRMRRQLVSTLWANASQLTWCDFAPHHTPDYFLWRVLDGTLTTDHPPIGASWSEWRARTATVNGEMLPKLLQQHPEWIAPFLMTYPHRTNRTMSAFADCVLGMRGELIAGPNAQHALPTTSL